MDTKYRSDVTKDPGWKYHESRKRAHSFAAMTDNCFMKKLILSVFSAGLLFAQAEAHFKFSVASPMTVAGTKLKMGEYKVDVENSEATFKIDGKSFKVPATVRTDATIFRDTTVESNESGVKAIHIGGTVTTVVFGATTASR
jgi:hypothetical protein